MNELFNIKYYMDVIIARIVVSIFELMVMLFVSAFGAYSGLFDTLLMAFVTALMFALNKREFKVTPGIVVGQAIAFFALSLIFAYLGFLGGPSDITYSAANGILLNSIAYALVNSIIFAFLFYSGCIWQLFQIKNAETMRGAVTSFKKGVEIPETAKNQAVGGLAQWYAIRIPTAVICGILMLGFWMYGFPLPQIILFSIIITTILMPIIMRVFGKFSW